MSDDTVKHTHRVSFGGVLEVLALGPAALVAGVWLGRLVASWLEIPFPW